MKRLGLRVEIVLNIVFITAVAMFLVGIVALKVTERVVLQGKVEGAKSIVTAVESLYIGEDGLKNLKNETYFSKGILESGGWMTLTDGENRVIFSIGSKHDKGKFLFDPLLQSTLRSGETSLEVDRKSFPPFTFYRGFKMASSLMKNGRPTGGVLLYMPLDSLERELLSLGKLISIYIILDLLILALLGFYILSSRIVKPVEGLIKVTEEIAEGRFPEKVDLGKTKEIKKLGKALEYMSREIKEGRDKLQEQVRALEEANRALIQTQKELIASEKLASLGRLSAGVAHEVGNPLSAIAGYVEVLKSRYTKLNEEKRKEFLTNIEREIERIDRIIRTLLDYARPMKFEAKRVDANELVRDTVDILKNQGAFKNTQLKIEFSSEPLPIEIDPHGVSQALINLVLNSIDATSSGGVITIGTTRLGERVEISVGDTGGGIPDEVLDKIFDPFFTTKELGKGTGLGLSISQRIVQFFGGNISVESRLGEGSVFRIRFPYRTEKNER